MSCTVTASRETPFRDEYQSEDAALAEACYLSSAGWYSVRVTTPSHVWNVAASRVAREDA